MTADISKSDWLNAPETTQVMAALLEMRPDCARFVGGCVRNALLGAPVDDIDIATQLRPEETIQALKAAGIRAIPTGIEHGTITAVCNSVPFEITSLRRDVETDGRRAVVAFTEDWAEDAQRRDFRMNALYADMEGQIHDPTGGGLKDIAERQIIFIGEAEERLREDHLRNLRFFRFSAWYGHELDEAGLKACDALAEGLKQIAAERIWKELSKLLGAPSPVAAVSAMKDCGVLDVILPEHDGVSRLISLSAFEERTSHSPDSMQRLMSLLPHEVDIASGVASRLKFSGKERERLMGWVNAPEPESLSVQPLSEWLYALPDGTGADYLIWLAAERKTDRFDAAIAFARDWQRPVFPIKGADLIAKGMKAGPQIGEELKRLENAWVKNGFSLEGPE